ncbi:MAG: VWA domain-containing protein, partial [Deltaproteobacteria bacterium]|nr:VWA domain-containing protein [Deltaproteobacteria bacterium]
MTSELHISRERPDSGLGTGVILFSRFLKSRGFKVFSSSVVGALQGLDKIDISAREDFFHVLRMNLVCTDLEWTLFPGLFEAFWKTAKKQGGQSREEEAGQEARPEDLLEEVLFPGARNEGTEDPENGTEREYLEGVGYSPVSVVETKDLGRFHKGDIPAARLVLKNIMSPFNVALSRRFTRSRRPGDIDFRQVMKKGLKSEGLPLALLFRRKKKRLKRLVVLADVSGSMDRYALFVMPFILGMKGVGSRAEVFVFSTSLTPVTHVIRKHTLDTVLEMIAGAVPDWSGGTRIGYSLHQFNEAHGHRHLNRRTVVLILSDGWDLGAKNLLRREMETLSAKVHAVIWLNPLAGDPEYSPLTRAMENILPFVDYLLPANSLQNLKRV